MEETTLVIIGACPLVSAEIPEHLSEPSVQLSRGPGPTGKSSEFMTQADFRLFLNSLLDLKRLFDILESSYSLKFVFGII
jgi:hypothetical protein